MNRREQGNSPVEVLISLLLLSLVLSAGYPLIQSITRQALELERFHQRVSNSIYLRRLLARVLDDIDAHPFPLWPRAHLRGRLFAADNGTLIIPGRSSDLDPHPDSDAITSFRLLARSSHRITKVLSTAVPVHYEACPRFGGTFDSTKIATFLAIGSDGFHELRGTSIRDRTASGCRIFSLTPTQSMFVHPLADFRADSVFELVPVDAVYTLYIDSQSRLRYLGYRGIEVIENQPLRENVEQLTLALHPLPESNHMLLRALYGPSHKRDVLIEKPHALERGHPLISLFSAAAE